MSLSAINAEIEGGTLRSPLPPKSDKVRKGARSLSVFNQVSKEFIIVKEYGLKVLVAHILVGVCAWKTKKRNHRTDQTNLSIYMNLKLT